MFVSILVSSFFIFFHLCPTRKRYCWDEQKHVQSSLIWLGQIHKQVSMKGHSCIIPSDMLSHTLLHFDHLFTFYVFFFINVINVGVVILFSSCRVDALYNLLLGRKFSATNVALLCFRYHTNGSHLYMWLCICCLL